jgi:hypothetical protein
VVQFEFQNPCKSLCAQAKRRHYQQSLKKILMRLSIRHFTRLANAFSKKVENHEHALALYFMFYNFCLVHQTLRVTPAMEAGIENHVWEIGEIIALL